MNIRPYHPNDRTRCLQLFDSNFPKYFAQEEKASFISWLDNPIREDYEVLTVDNTIIACGGIYFAPHENAAGLAWGMVHNSFHKMGYGKQLTLYRLEKLMIQFPDVTHKVETSQHTFGFYQLMGFKTVDIVKDGFAPGLDKYVMKKNF